MNLRSIVKLTNIVAGISILLLIYWVFAFVVTQVFGFRVFRENITQTFSMSVLAILALMGGSLMLNVMFNLTRIAQKHNADESIESRQISRNWILGFVLTFPLIFAGLFAGDYLTAKKKENLLLQSARTIVEKNVEKSSRLVNYEFSDAWLNDSRETLTFFEKTDRNFPHVSMIVRDTVDGVPVFLAFRDYVTLKNDKGEVVPPEKKSFLMRTTQPDRDFLNRIFDSGSDETRFTSSDGSYELFYPYTKDGKTIVLHFSDYQRYGKMGS